MSLHPLIMPQNLGDELVKEAVFRISEEQAARAGLDCFLPANP
jgi:hypothetical protein